jgi:AraC family transcriptional regulator, regulatory protein of adaptative response / methylated-DNA-[protein]-cysteine methyltransferase
MLQHVSTIEMNDEQRWTAVAGRDRRADGSFYYAVTSTGVFCRPSCPSKRPRRDRVRFFATPSDAEEAGYRPCLRCHPSSTTQESGASTAIRRAAMYLTAHVDQPVSLAELGGIVKLSPSYLQREFKRALGLSPREYHAALRAERFRRTLRSGEDVTTATYDAGYGSPSRVYEGEPTGRGVRPSAYRRGAAGIEIGYALVGSPLGRLLVAATASGVCAVKLGDSNTTLEADLRREFSSATLSEGRIVKAEWVSAIVNALGGSDREIDLPLDVRGTAFQWRVWRALQQIPFGETRSYSEIAATIGRPRATRAVARACASNPVCLVVPCHRVVPKNGGAGGYRWGMARKRRLLQLESTHATGGARKAK